MVTMRFFLTLMIVFVLGLNCSAQQFSYSFTNDSTRGAVTKYVTSVNAITLYRGIATFQFTTAHDTATIYLEGNNGGSIQNGSTVWFPVDTITCSGTAAVNKRFVIINPEFIYYRLKKVGNSGDTCYFTNQRFIYKY
jgi:hypothetical protein